MSATKMFLLSLLPALCVFALAQAECPDNNWTKFGESCYRLVDMPQPWYQAEQVCKLLDSHLASVASADENEFLVSLSSQSRHWPDREFLLTLGASNLVSNNRSALAWVDGSPFNYTNFDQTKNPCDVPGGDDDDSHSHSHSHSREHEPSSRAARMGKKKKKGSKEGKSKNKSKKGSHGKHSHGHSGSHEHHDGRWCTMPRCLRLAPKNQGLWYTGPCNVPMSFFCKIAADGQSSTATTTSEAATSSTTTTVIPSTTTTAAQAGSTTTTGQPRFSTTTTMSMKPGTL